MIEAYSKCEVCPVRCKANRFEKPGFCGAGTSIKINISQLHHNEEPVLSGNRGSGTIFFSHCNLKCIYCQNYIISHHGKGSEISDNNLVDVILKLQSDGAHNINLVSPTQYTPQIASVLKVAKKSGLYIPVVWNSNAYETVESLRLLEGLVDIYLPDVKYSDSIIGKEYSGVNNYFETAKLAIKEMFWQVGNLVIDESGLAKRGIMIRLLNLPDNKNGIDETLKWIASNFGTEVYISLMSQYYPAYKAVTVSGLNRGINTEEYNYAKSIVEYYGFENGFIQDIVTSDACTPKFNE